MPKFKTHKKNPKKNLLNEVAPHPKSKMGDDYGLYMILANFRNALYNTYDEFKDEGLTPQKINIIIWAYPYRFFTYNGMINELRIGSQNIRKDITLMKKKGWIEEYSPRQNYEFSERRDKWGDGKEFYYEVVSKTLAPRYCLTAKGRRFAEKFASLFKKDIYAKRLFDEDRELEIKF